MDIKKINKSKKNYDIKLIELPKMNNKTNNLVFINNNITQPKKDELILTLNFDKL